MFGHSPVKNDSLQKHVIASHSQELHRLQILLKFHAANAEKILTEILTNLVDVLERMEIGSVNISVNDSSLLDADQII